MNRVIIKRGDNPLNIHYDFLGDFDCGVWQSKWFRLAPAALLHSPNVVWLPTKWINEKHIYWPHVRISFNDYQILRYTEIIKATIDS
jgi:hypothetical protein